MDGNYYCDADINDDYLEEYWDECGSDGLISQDQFVYWNDYRSNYIYMITDLKCTNTLVEFSSLKRLYKEIQDDDFSRFGIFLTIVSLLI